MTASVNGFIDDNGIVQYASITIVQIMKKTFRTARNTRTYYGEDDFFLFVTYRATSDVIDVTLPKNVIVMSDYCILHSWCVRQN